MTNGYSLTLEASTGEAEPRQIELSEFPAKIGRQEDCAVALDDPKVSRVHLAVELRPDGLHWVDQGSSNGFRLNDRRVSDERVRRADRVRVGSTVLRVVALQRPPTVAPSASASSSSTSTTRSTDGDHVVRGAQRRRFYNRVLVSALVVALVGGVAYWVSNKTMVETRGTDPNTIEMRAEAEVELDKLRQLPSSSDADLAQLVQRARALKSRFGGRDLGLAVNPVDEFYNQVENRYQIQNQQRIYALMLQQEVFLEEGRYGQALTFLKQRQEGARSDSERALMGQLLVTAQGQAEEAYEAFLTDLSYLRDYATATEVEARIGRALQQFEGTRFSDALRAQGGAYARTQAALLAAAKRREDARAAAAATAKGEAEVAPTSLLALLSGPIAEGKLMARTYAFGDLRGKPVAMEDATRVVVESSAGKQTTLEFDEVPKQTQLEMSIDTLGGGELLEGARIAFEWGHHGLGGRMLHQFLRETDEGRDARQQRIDEFLAETRGLERPPAGGYSFQGDHGWEDAVQTRERLVLAEVSELTGELSRKAKERKLVAAVTTVNQYLEDPVLGLEAKQQIRSATIARLESIRSDLVQDATKLVGRQFDGLAELKKDLDQKRTEAIELIMDPVIYLPESHPDWPKGDHLNGQREVDAKVRPIRMIWNAAEKKSLRLGPKVMKVLAQVTFVETDLMPRLRYERTAEAEPILTTLKLNPHPRLNVRSFAATTGDAKLYTWNRRVEQYNRELTHPDLPEQDRQHVIFMNDYREMMGLQRTFIDVRLCRATRKHSEVCNAAGRIWHDGPNGTPQSRANAEGFTDGVGENVALGYGNPKDIWTRGWYRASDHHRNAIGAGWNCMGYGYFGQVGTQNFATTKPPFDDVESPDSP